MRTTRRGSAPARVWTATEKVAVAALAGDPVAGEHVPGKRLGWADDPPAAHIPAPGGQVTHIGLRPRSAARPA